MKAQAESHLIFFWSTLDKAWFALFPECPLLAASPDQSSPDESSAPLSAVTVLDLQRAIAAQKAVSIFSSGFVTHLT
jgi:hypothetical protein